MIKLFFIAISILFVFASGIVLSEDGKVVTSDEFIQKFSDSASQGPKDFQMRGLVPRKEAPEVAIKVLFKFGSTEIADGDSKMQLDEAGKALSSEILSQYQFEITGHTDSVGSAEFNRQLSEKRSNAIKDMLCEKYGISRDRIVSTGHGESDPVASNDTAEGRSKNRRVVIKRLN